MTQVGTTIGNEASAELHRSLVSGSEILFFEMLSFGNNHCDACHLDLLSWQGMGNTDAC